MKYIIEDAVVHYENIRVKIGEEWYFLNPSKLKGLKIEGEIVEKRTRNWLI